MEGRIEYSEYEKNGENRQSTEIILEDMSLLSKPQAAPQPTQQPNPSPQHQPMGAPQQSDDLPF
jgi:single-stranded DNA-binding protein